MKKYIEYGSPDTDGPTVTCHKTFFCHTQKGLGPKLAFASEAHMYVEVDDRMGVLMMVAGVSTATVPRRLEAVDVRG